MRPASASKHRRPPVQVTQDRELDWLSLAEYLWCQQHRDRIFKPLPQLPQASEPDEPLEEPDLDTHSEQKRPPSDLPTPLPPPPNTAPHPEPEKLSVAPDPRHHSLDTQLSRAYPAPVGVPIPLPGQRALARALRPLARRVRHGRLKLDIAATVEQTAAQGGLFQPQMRRATQRWLELDLVVDTGDSVTFWQGLADDVERMLSLPGAFRRIRRWNLRDLGGSWQLETINGQHAKLSSIANGHAARCILILTDTLGDLWFQKESLDLLTTLSASNATILLHLLPPRLWERTGLAGASLARISSPERGSANRVWRASDPGANYALPPGLPIPCLNFEASHFARFASLLAGAKNNSLQGLLLSCRHGQPAQEDSSIDAPPAETSTAAPPDPSALDHFFALASRGAARLACYLAAAPLVPAVMRMVQETFAHTTRHWHLTEVLCGGLVEQSPHLGEIDGMVCYSWLPGVRAQLLRRSPISETRQVWRHIGDWLATQESHSLRQLTALWQHPQGTIEANLSREELFFAEVNAEVWQTWGGEWAVRGRRLAAKLEPKSAPQPPQPKPVPPPGMLEESQQFGSLSVAHRTGGAPVELLRSKDEVVFLAFDNRTRRLVELHVLRGGSSLDSASKRSTLERARQASEIRGHAFMRILEVGEDQGLVYYTSNLNDGEYAEEYVRRRGPLSASIALTLVCSLLDELLLFQGYQRVLSRMQFDRVLITTLEDTFLQLRVVDYGLSLMEETDDARNKAHLVVEICRLLFLLLTGQPHSGENPDKLLTKLPVSLRITVRTGLIDPENVTSSPEKLRQDLMAALSALVSAIQARNLRKLSVATGQLMPISQFEELLLENVPMETILGTRFKVENTENTRSSSFSIPAVNVKADQPVTVHLLPPSRIVEKNRYEAVPLQMWRFNPDRHPNILRSLSLWESPDWTFLTEEREPGFALSRLMAERITLNTSEVLILMRQVRAGQDQAFECGVQRVDLHPSNILLRVGKNGPMQSRERERLIQKRLDAWPSFIVKLRPHMTMRGLYEIPLVDEEPWDSQEMEEHMRSRDFRHRSFVALLAYLLTGEHQGGRVPQFPKTVPDAAAAYLRECVELTHHAGRTPSPSEFLDRFESLLSTPPLDLASGLRETDPNN